MQQKLRIVFMGTPEFAVESLKALIESGENIVGVVTAPDKPSGRGKKLTSSAVKIYAEKSGIKSILQPTNLKDEEFIEQLKELKADLQVVVAFRMLPEKVWAMPTKGTINLHASLLPNYRGAAPINRAIMNGEKETGVTTFFIEKEIDTGHLIYAEKVTITDNMDAGELHDLLMVKGAKLLAKTVLSIEEGNCPSQPQTTSEHGVALKNAPKIFRDDCRIDWSLEGRQIHNFIRGLSPYPTAWTEIILNDEPVLLKIYKAHFSETTHNFSVGTFQTLQKKQLFVPVKDGMLFLETLQQAGKKAMSAEEFLKGMPNIEAYRLVR